MKIATPLLLAATLTASAAGAQGLDGVVINELVASNDSVGGYAEPDGGYGDWVELYNAGANAVDLSGANLSDDYATLDKWAFPAGTTVDAGAYLIVWADNDEGQTGIHTSYSLKKDGEELVLSRGGVVADSVRYFAQQTNVALARRPNGTGPFVLQAPTPAASNGGPVGTREAAPTLKLVAAPTVSSGAVTVQLPADLAARTYTVVDAAGRRVLAGPVAPGAAALALDAAPLAAGTYTVVLDAGRARARFQRQ